MAFSINDFRDDPWCFCLALWDGPLWMTASWLVSVASVVGLLRLPGTHSLPSNNLCQFFLKTGGGLPQDTSGTQVWHFIVKPREMVWLSRFIQVPINAFASIDFQPIIGLVALGSQSYQMCFSNQMIHRWIQYKLTKHLIASALLGIHIHVIHGTNEMTIHKQYQNSHSSSTAPTSC